MNQAVFRTRIGRDQRVVEEVLIVCRRQIILAQINIPSERERCKARLLKRTGIAAYRDSCTCVPEFRWLAGYPLRPAAVSQ